MKIDRRCFLSFTIGGAAGTALSPLPWKLTDDLSIWTQNWPWTPVPPDGAYSYQETACPLCDGGCGLSLRKVDDRAVKIDGTPGHPINDGGVCPLAVSSLQLLYGPTRVKGPLKRVGERGEGKWQRISWETAIAMVANKLGDIRKSDGAQSLACIADSDRGTVPQLLKRLLTANGSPNFFRMPSMEDTYETVLQMTQGVQASAAFDLENADFVLSFGSGILDGWGAPVRMFRAHSLWKENKVPLVQIEPRLSNTAAKSDRWVALKPGTEGALALGIAHIIIQESLFDEEFVSKAAGFDEWKAMVLKDFGPENVAALTGVAKEAIIDLGRHFGKASHPIALCGRGEGSRPGSVAEVLAVQSLNALVGSLNNKGGVWSVAALDYIKWPDVELDAVATKGLQADRIDGAGGKQFPLANHLLNRLPAAVQEGENSPVQAMLVYNANPVHSLPDTQAVAKAFARIPFVVSFSTYLDETVAQADLVLPNDHFLERYSDVPVMAGLMAPVIGLTRPLVDRQCNTRNTGDVVIQVAKSMGGAVGKAFPWTDYESCLKETLGGNWKPLMDKTYYIPQKNQEPAPANFKFLSKRMASLVSAAEASKDSKGFPLMLISFDSMRIPNGYIGGPPFMIKTVSDTVLQQNDILVELNPKTAHTYGLVEGSQAMLSTPIAEANVKVHLSDGIMPGVVAIATGLGHTAFDSYLAGKGVNANLLIGSQEDPASGFDAAWGAPAKLVKA
jgi:anaerobic selenocysteine-containing dehydrogenase